MSSLMQKKSNRRCLLEVERLEGRDLMSASPVLFSAISEGNPNTGFVFVFADAPPAAGQTSNEILPSLSLSPMMKPRSRAGWRTAQTSM